MGAGGVGHWSSTTHFLKAIHTFSWEICVDGWGKVMQVTDDIVQKPQYLRLYAALINTLTGRIGMTLKGYQQHKGYNRHEGK